MKILTAAVVAAGLAIAAPATANADESSYLDRLTADGFVITSETAPVALQAGAVLCAEMRRGVPRENLAVAAWLAIPRATVEQGQALAYAAQRELCPETAE